MRNFQFVIPEMKSRANSTARDRANKTQSTDSPASPEEPIALSSGDENVPTPPQWPKKHRVEVNDDGYAEVYRKSSSFIHKGATMHTTEIAEVQNTGDTTVFRRTQTLETATDLAMSEVVKHLGSVYTPEIPIAKPTAPTVKFVENPEDVWCTYVWIYKIVYAVCY